MKNKLLLLSLCLPLLAGCIAKQEAKAKKRIQATCECLMGCSEEEVVLELGAPQKIQTIGKIKVYEYYKSYGSRSNRNDYLSNSNDSLWGTAITTTYEAYDKIEVFFRNGYATNWKSSVKR